MVESLPCSAGDMGWIPGWGTKIPHAADQISPRAPTTEPMCSGARVPQLREACPPQLEKPTHRNKGSRMLQQRFCVLQLRPDKPNIIN